MEVVEFYKFSLWDSELRYPIPMIKRDRYLDRLWRSRGNGFPKVITGLRRCGKSYLLDHLFRDKLLQTGVQEDEILSIRLDDDKNAHLRNPLLLGSYVREKAVGKERLYVFLDEIQEVVPVPNPGFSGMDSPEAKGSLISFVDVVLGLSREENIDLYATGSNSKFLSSDIVTEFRDKSTQIRVRPLSFEEYSAHSRLSPYEALYEYMRFGGMPRFADGSEEERKEYLAQLLKTTYARDIVERNNLKRESALFDLLTVLSDEAGMLVSPAKIAGAMRVSGRSESDGGLIARYVSFLEDSFLVEKAFRFDIRGKKRIGALWKCYFTDLGIRNAALSFSRFDEGRLLENLVYNELLYHGYSVSIGMLDIVGKDKDGRSVRETLEIDFRAEKGNRLFYVQVSADPFGEKTKAREVRPFLRAKDSIPKIIVTSRPIPEMRDEYGFLWMSATDFLLKYIS